MAAAAARFRTPHRRLSFVPLLASFALSALLIVFGSGPARATPRSTCSVSSRSRSSACCWCFSGGILRALDVLRHAHETRASLVRLTRHIDIPPVEYTLPARVRGAFAAVFFLQKDMARRWFFAACF